MLEKEDQGVGLEEGGVLAVELGFTKLWRPVRGWLSEWVASQRRSRHDGLIDGGSWCYCSGGGCIFGV